jgi:hypothetical protein
MLTIIELYYLIKLLNDYEEGIIDKIKYFYEYELEFIQKCKKYILYKSDFISYCYIKNFMQYNYVKLHIHCVPSTNCIIKFNIHLVYDNEFQELNIYYNLNFYQIIKIILKYFKKNKNYIYKKNDIMDINEKNLFDILLEKQSIYKKI